MGRLSWIAFREMWLWGEEQMRESLSLFCIYTWTLGPKRYWGLIQGWGWKYIFIDTWNDIPRQWWVFEGHWCKTTWKRAIIGLVKRQGQFKLSKP